MKTILITIAIVFSGMLMQAQSSPNDISHSSKTGNENTQLTLVQRVVDGDTFVIESGEKVRLIGIDTPETVHPRKPVEPFGPEASEFTKKLLEGKQVELEFDVDKYDRYNRLLAYVYVDGIFLNEELVRQGLAVISTFPPNVKYVEIYEAAQKYARENRLGIWSL